MAKVKVEVLNAIVDGKSKGSQLNIEDKDAGYLESLGYVKRVAKQSAAKKDEPKPEVVSKDSAK